MTTISLLYLTCLRPAPSQAVIAPLTEELATKEVLQFAGNRLEGHCVFLDSSIKTVYILPQIGQDGKIHYC